MLIQQMEVRREQRVVQDHLKQLRDRVPDLHGIVGRHGRGAAHGADASEAIRRGHGHECAAPTGEARGEG